MGSPAPAQSCQTARGRSLGCWLGVLSPWGPMTFSLLSLVVTLGWSLGPCGLAAGRLSHSARDSSVVPMTTPWAAA